MAISEWRAEDMEELDEYRLAEDLESMPSNLTELGRDGEAYNMSEVLNKLLQEDYSSEVSDSPYPFSPAHASHLLDIDGPAPPTDVLFTFTLKAPTAHGIKTSHEFLTYLNRGQPYEMKVEASKQYGNHSPNALYKSVLSLSFTEVRLKNCESEQFESWCNEHPVDRLIEIDKRGCDGLSSVQNDEHSLNSITFIWSPLQHGTLCFKINCLSTEFAARKHGGEKGVPLQLVVDTYSFDGDPSSPGRHLHRTACNVKVFKDKGGDRRQKQDQQKIEKLSPHDQTNFHPSQSVTNLDSLPLPVLTPSKFSGSSVPHTPLASHGARGSLDSSASVASPYSVPTPPSCGNHGNQPCHDITMTSSMQETRDWLINYRFSQFLSLFANYIGADLLRLSRSDLVELCGAADGIRMYNTLRSTVVRTVYVCHEHEKVYHALCLEQLTAGELLEKVAEKLKLQTSEISILLRLTSSGILVMVDDTVVQHFRDDECFMIQTLKEESNQYQVVLKDQASDSEHVSLAGSIPRTVHS